MQDKIQQLKQLVNDKREIEKQCDLMVSESWGRCDNDVTDTDFYALMKQRDEKTKLIEQIIIEL